LKIFHFFLLLFVAITALADGKPFAPETLDGATIVSAEEAVELILSKPELIVIDSRKRTEHVKGHIEGSINILNTELSLKKLESIAPSRTSALLFYCNGERCLRSSDSIKKAVGWGYTNLYWFRGGWKEWSEKRLPMVID